VARLPVPQTAHSHFQLSGNECCHAVIEYQLKRHKPLMSFDLPVPDSQRLRTCAQECRSLAKLFHSQAMRNHLLEIAANYDHLSMKAAAIELMDADRES
jgi:hypothetical protein